MTSTTTMTTTERPPGSIPHPEATPLVRIRDISYTFGQGEVSNRVLTDNNLDLYPGEIVIMTGQSGSGKTTLLTLIGGLRRIQPNSGNIEVLGQELARMNAEGLVGLRRKIGFIFQAHNLFGSLTALQNVRLALEVGDGRGPYRTEAQVQQRALDLLKRLGLETKVYNKPHQLSGGQRQRVAIARALANDPRLILADEPTAALDAESADIVVGLLKEIVTASDKTAIVVTHDAKILESAHRIVNLRYGEIVSNINVERAKTICKFLKECKALKALFPDRLTELDLAIADRMSEEAFAPGSVIIRQGDVGDKFYMIHQGIVDVTRVKDGSTFHDQIAAGGFFGEVALMTLEPRNATVVARTDVELFVLKKDQFQEILRLRAGFEEQLQAVLAHRL
jgi:putative ABC transport system ATP-binding protein